MNKLRNETQFTIGDESHLMRPTFDCMIGIEERTGKTIPSFQQLIMSQTFSVTDTVAVLVEGTKTNEEPLAEADAQLLIETHGILEVQEALYDFIVTMLRGGPAFEESAKKK